MLNQEPGLYKRRFFGTWNRMRVANGDGECLFSWWIRHLTVEAANHRHQNRLSAIFIDFFLLSGFFAK